MAGAGVAELSPDAAGAGVAALSPEAAGAAGAGAMGVALVPGVVVSVTAGVEAGGVTVTVEAGCPANTKYAMTTSATTTMPPIIQPVDELVGVS